VTESELIQGCVTGDKKSKDDFILRFLPIIYGSIRNRTKSHFEKYGKRVSHDELEDIIEELAHDVVISLLDDNCKALKVFEGKGGCPLEGYIGTIAIRKAIDYWRSIKNMTSIQESEDSVLGPSKELIDAQIDSDAEENITGFIHKELVSKLLSYLDKDDKLLCELVFIQEQRSETIAEVLGISIDNLYVRKQRVLRKLRDISQQKKLC
jgi:RNA polymerase sigma factor (sigma-70 family)